MSGAGNRGRTGDLNLGKIGFYYDCSSPVNGPNLLIGNAFSLTIEYWKALVKEKCHLKCHQFNCQLPPYRFVPLWRQAMLLNFAHSQMWSKLKL